MNLRKRESFVRGAFMLTLAALVSRLLGALYKPIVARIFAPFDGQAGAAGIGLTQVPLSAYQVVLAFTSVGLNVGISRLVAERMALGDVRGGRRVFRVSLLLMAGLGLLASVVMFVGAPWLARLVARGAMETVPGFRATAPALLVVSVMAAYRGLFQGFQQMTPNAYSQIIEQMVRVIAGIVLTFVVMHVTHSVPLGAAAFNFGDVLGALAGLLYLLVLARRAGEGLWATGEEATAAEPPSAALVRETPWELIRRILAVAGPVAISGAVVPLMMVADTFFVFQALPEPEAEYGRLTNAFMITYLPAVFTTAIYTSILPAMAEAMAREDVHLARKRAAQAYRMTLLLAIPAQTGLYVLAEGIYTLLFGDPSGAVAMAAIAWATVPIMLQQTTAGVLQGIGKIVLPVRNFMLGALVKIVLSALWTPAWGVRGAAYATAVGFTVAAVLNVIFVERLLGRTLKTRGMILKPLAASLVMAGGIALVRGPLTNLIPNVHVVTLLLIAFGGALYGIAALLVRAVRRQDMERLPGVGRRLAAWLVRLGLLR